MDFTDPGFSLFINLKNGGKTNVKIGAHMWRGTTISTQKKKIKRSIDKESPFSLNSHQCSFLSHTYWQRTTPLLSTAWKSPFSGSPIFSSIHLRTVPSSTLSYFEFNWDKILITRRGGWEKKKEKKKKNEEWVYYLLLYWKKEWLQNKQHQKLTFCIRSARSPKLPSSPLPGRNENQK